METEDVFTSKAAESISETDWINTREAADLLGCSVQNIHWHITNKNLTEVKRLGEGLVAKPIVMVSRAEVLGLDKGITRRGQLRRSEIAKGMKTRKRQDAILSCAVCEIQVKAPPGTPEDTTVLCQEHKRMRRCPECAKWFEPKKSNQIYDQPSCSQRARDHRRPRNQKSTE